MKLAFAHGPLPREGTLVVFAAPDGTLSRAARELDATGDGVVRRALALAGERRKHGEILDLTLPRGLELERLLIAVVGKEEGLRPLDLERLGAALVKRLEGLRVREAAVAAPDGLSLGLAPERAILALATGARLYAWRFTKYRPSPGDEEPPALESLRLIGASEPQPEERRAMEAVVDSVHWCRELVSEPANELSPKRFAEILEGLGELGVEVEVLDRDALDRLGMRALLAVAQGSARPPFVVLMRWRGAERSAPLALVGKGVCFDSGGISIKPSQGMEDMKWDMAGAAAVCGAVRALALRKAKADVVAAVGLVENMPSGTAQRPGDVVRAYSGKTVEVINTDAEGRLVLADLLAYVIERYQPEAVIDLATLTGAIITALGHERAGLFSNDDGLAERLCRLGEETGERLWRLPLGEEYAKHIKSDIAEIKNVGRGREAGSIAGAVFLEAFVDKRPWAHLDIAGVAWSQRDLPLSRKGATGFGVRLLDRFVAEVAESA